MKIAMGTVYNTVSGVPGKLHEHEFIHNSFYLFIFILSDHAKAAIIISQNTVNNTASRSLNRIGSALLSNTPTIPFHKPI